MRRCRVGAAVGAAAGKETIIYRFFEYFDINGSTFKESRSLLVILVRDSGLPYCFPTRAKRGWAGCFENPSNAFSKSVRPGCCEFWASNESWVAFGVVWGGSGELDRGAGFDGLLDLRNNSRIRSRFRGGSPALIVD